MPINHTFVFILADKIFFYLFSNSRREVDRRKVLNKIYLLQLSFRHQKLKLRKQRQFFPILWYHALRYCKKTIRTTKRIIFTKENKLPFFTVKILDPMDISGKPHTWLIIYIDKFM